VVDGVVVDPEVVAPDRAVHVEADAGGVGGPEGDDVGLAADAFSALGELQDGVVGDDLAAPAGARAGAVMRLSVGIGPGLG
jgi:hypothetical protein